MYIKKVRAISHKKDRKYLQPTRVLFKMELSSTPIRIERILSVLYSDKAESSKVGTKASQL
jgi:hypothetical protein